jgi:drug/metabolite transporter (DMT)-like permease
MSGLGLALSLIPAFFELPRKLPVNGVAVGGVVYDALVPTVGGFLLCFAAASRIDGAQASAFTALLPISATALAAIVLHETIAPAQWLGMVCVLAAVLLIARDGARSAIRR